MSTGFHYLATMEQSLAMQWTGKRELPVVLGRMTAVASLASLVTYGLVFGALTLLELSYLQVFLLGGGITLGIAALCWFGFPHFSTLGASDHGHRAAPAVLALLRAGVHVGRAPADLHRLRRVHDGGDLRLRRGRTSPCSSWSTASSPSGSRPR